MYEFDEPEVVAEPDPAQQTLEVAAEPPPREPPVPARTPEPVLEAVPEPPVRLRPEPEVGPTADRAHTSRPPAASFTSCPKARRG